MSDYEKRLEIAIAAYRAICEAIITIEEIYKVECKLPCYIDVDGERFFTHKIKSNSSEEKT